MDTKQPCKRAYMAPKVEFIELDNDISLSLDSYPPTYEHNNIKTPDFLSPEPYNTQLA